MQNQRWPCQRIFVKKIPTGATMVRKSTHGGRGVGLQNLPWRTMEDLDCGSAACVVGILKIFFKSAILFIAFFLPVCDTFLEPARPYLIGPRFQLMVSRSMPQNVHLDVDLHLAGELAI